MSRQTQLDEIFTHMDAMSVLALTVAAPGLYKCTWIAAIITFLCHHKTVI